MPHLGVGGRQLGDVVLHEAVELLGGDGEVGGDLVGVDENLLQMGLIKGGDLDNAIVIYERQLTQEKMDIITDIMKVPRMDATHLGYIMHRPLVWDNEPARHKLLDIIGDMALCGHPILGSIKALKPGHRVNNQLARMIRAKVK